MSRACDWAGGPHLRRLGLLADLPALALAGARGEEIDEVDRLEAGFDDLWQRADRAHLWGPHNKAHVKDHTLGGGNGK